MESIPKENQVETKSPSFIDNMLSMKQELADEVNNLRDADEIFLRFTVSMLAENDMYEEVDSTQFCIQSNRGETAISIKDTIVSQSVLMVLSPRVKLSSGQKGLVTVNILTTDKNGQTTHPREFSCDFQID